MGHSNMQRVIEDLEKTLEQMEVDETTPLLAENMVAVLHKPRGPFRVLEFHASDSEAKPNTPVRNSKVTVQLPSELNPDRNSTIVFCMMTWPQTEGPSGGASQDELYERRLVGLSVRSRRISGLQQRVNITMKLTTKVKDSPNPECVFLNFSSKEYSSDGCETLWEPHLGRVTCSCDHLTYFGVLMTSASLSRANLEVMTYISLAGCSLSLLALVVTVLLFITKRSIKADVSMRVHVSLAVALILLNLHFLPSQAVAAGSSTAFCFYMALSLHYSLLASFSWMALESFHLYLLLVRVFNIYIRRYMLKLSLVGWSVPAVVVSLVVLVDRDAYGRTPLSSFDPNSTTICYISNSTVKMVTTVGVFCFVFAFNLIMLAVTVQRVLRLRHRKEFGQNDCARAKKDICTLLGVTTLLGIPWGLIFFSFGDLSVPGLYLFSIFNSLQGFFIFLWFVMSLKKTGGSSARTSSDIRSTNSEPATQNDPRDFTRARHGEPRHSPSIPTVTNLVAVLPECHWG
ncbi:adhesion G-protein coupled receptor G2 [Aulostomus maculatus]